MKFLLGFLLFAVSAHALDQFPPVLHFGPTNSYGRELQRSLRMMADSPNEKKRTVRVLLFGQSITMEHWTVWMTDYLRDRFPNANLVITNLAMGMNSDLLIRSAERDITSFYPDLMFYHNYGPVLDFEKIVACARLRTTADIIIQTDHPVRPDDLTEETDPTVSGGLRGDAWRNYSALPDIAERYGAELAHIRSNWKQYLADYSLQPSDVLRDNVHPNWTGNFVMFELLKSCLRVDRSFPDGAWRDAEKTYEIGKDVDWVEDELHLPFAGNRVDVIADGRGETPIEVRIDGRRPSELPELYYFTRSEWYPGTYWIWIMQIKARKPLVDEDWTAKILSFSTNNNVPVARYEMKGSRTGYDGEGDTYHPFTSNSGRLIIEPADWLSIYWGYAFYPRLPLLEPGQEFHWRSQLSGKDEFVPEVPDPSLESNITVAQGLANGQHLLVLKRIGTTPIRSIRIFNPLARTQPSSPTKPAIGKLALGLDGLLLQVSGVGRYVLEGSVDCRQWRAMTAPISDPAVALPLEEKLQFFRVRAID